MTKEEKRIVWNHISTDPYTSAKKLYQELIPFVYVSLSTIRKYRRIILKNIEEKGEE